MAVTAESVDVSSPMFRRLTDYKAILIQAVILRLSTARGTYWDDPEYGLDLTEFVNEHLTQNRLIGLATEVKTEIEKDERIATARASLSLDGSYGDVRIVARIEIDPVEGESFSMTIAVSELTVELLTRGA